VDDSFPAGGKIAHQLNREKLVHIMVFLEGLTQLQ